MSGRTATTCRTIDPSICHDSSLYNYNNKKLNVNAKQKQEKENETKQSVASLKLAKLTIAIWEKQKIRIIKNDRFNVDGFLIVLAILDNLC